MKLKHWWNIHCTLNPNRVKSGKQLIDYCVNSGLYGPTDLMCVVLGRTESKYEDEAKALVMKNMPGDTYLHRHLSKHNYYYTIAMMGGQYSMRKKWFLSLNCNSSLPGEESPSNSVS